jgi:hypothetical protein
VIGFDNIMLSILNIFTIITLEGWTDVMYMVRQSAGGVFYDFFFVLCVVFGSFFVLNLMIAVQFSSLEGSMDPPKAQKQDNTADDKGDDDEDEDEDDEAESSTDSNAPGAG